MKKIILFIFVFAPLFLKAQLVPVENAYQNYFDEAYQLYPDIPEGLLEAVSYQQTRMSHLTEDLDRSCTGMPQYLGVMGLIENGEGYFNENLKTIALYSGKDVQVLKNDPREEILAYANAYHQILVANPSSSTNEEKLLLLVNLTEIPTHLNLAGNYFAFDTYLYGLVQFITDPEMQQYYGFPNPKIKKEILFGDRLSFLSTSSHVSISTDYIENEDHMHYDYSSNELVEKTADYGPALWNAAASCNYSSRLGTAVTAVTVHTVQGSYSGCISWFQNCSAQVSCHYVMRSSDGQVTQQVLESDKAWHVGSNNPYTVGIEHEGFVSNPAWYTPAMYNSSSALTIDICNSHGINKLRTGWWPWLSAVNHADDGIPGSCVHVKGHAHFPSQTHSDPGIYWDWNRYYKLINTPPAPNMITVASGNFYDSGGSGSNYINDERTIWTIAPAGATNVTVTFNSFNLENTWDYLYIYDGADLNASLIGYYTGSSNPGTITSSGGSLTFEFRSDCATTAPGWQAVYSSNSIPAGGDSIAPVSSISINNIWQTADFPVDFTDTEEPGGSGLEKSFYHVSYFDGSFNYANQNTGFLRDEFDAGFINPQWIQQTGTWSVSSGFLEQNDEALSNTNIYASLEQQLSNIYMYEFSASIGGSGLNRRAGFHFYCDSAHLTNRGNSYFVWMRPDQQEVEIYKVTNDVFSLMQTDPISMNADQFYNYKVFFDRITGNIKVFMDNQLITEWTDPVPHVFGNYVSFRTGNANLKVGNVRVYRSRYSNALTTVTVGLCGTCDLLFQNSAPSISAGSIYTFSKDSADNLSPTVMENVNVDWTAPDPLYYVNDISIFDEDTIPSNNLAGGNWNIATDTNSAIAKYYYCIGTTAGDSDVVNWNDNWFYTNFSDTISLITNQWYYITAKSENGAGLQSISTSSDGFVYVNLDNEEEKTPHISVYPNPANEFIYLDGFNNEEQYKLEWIDLHGSVIAQQMLQTSGAGMMISVPTSLSNSIYLVRLSSGKNVYHVRVEIIR